VSVVLRVLAAPVSLGFAGPLPPPLSPRRLLLDEPFGMLDSLTRIELQDVLLDLWAQDRKTALMVTHDVDESPSSPTASSR
jgi:ABC-type taurine transport system ATPase subunit